ncbi:hypothetical protein ACFWMR_02110 [Amycolatopsis thailandensis]|uniref:hypothetical protein n=1 Tax=Amycolatopsis thailandensis TaxID=589330 RepID=UPI0036471379
MDQETESDSAAAALTPEHRDALDGCYGVPQPVAEVGDDAEWQLLFDLRDAGLVTFGDDSTHITITATGVEYMDHDEDEGEDDETERAYDFDTDILDLFYSKPLGADEFRQHDEWDLIAPLLDNELLSGPDEDDLLHITDAGIAVLDS